ncbi:hypothetical protein AGMMS50233_07920 [Endomicrobiia bacterium]|nr:hypothetical protein AGMMS50233_07920 [Endomicrobiia bacterium]
MIKKLSLRFNSFVNILKKLRFVVNIITGKIKILHLYLVKEFLGHFILGMIIFSTVLLITVVFDTVDMLISKGVALSIVLKMFIFQLPDILSFSIPMAILFGVLMAYTRLSSNNEITIMKSSGLNYKTLTMPIIILVCAISLFLVFFNHLLAPSINVHKKVLWEELIAKRPLFKIQEKSVILIGDYSLYANEVKSEDNTLSEVNIYKFEDKDNNGKNTDKRNVLPQKDKGSWRIAAPSAKVKACKNGVLLTLYDGWWQKAHPSDTSSMLHVAFGTYTFFIPFGDAIENSSILISAIKTPELIKTIKQYRSQNRPIKAYEKDLWLRWVMSFAPLAFVIIALPIGIMTSRGGKAVSYIASLGIIVTYYALLIISGSLGEKEYISFGIILWLPNFVITTVGIYLFRKMVKK